MKTNSVLIPQPVIVRCVSFSLLCVSFSGVSSVVSYLFPLLFLLFEFTHYNAFPFSRFVIFLFCSVLFFLSFFIFSFFLSFILSLFLSFLPFLSFFLSFFRAFFSSVSFLILFFFLNKTAVSVFYHSNKIWIRVC